MRLGPLEIVIIIIVIIAMAVIARITRTSRGTARQNSEPPAEVSVNQMDKRTGRTRNFLKRLGLALVLVGAILLISGLVSFKFAIYTYILSAILIALGIIMLLLLKNR